MAIQQLARVRALPKHACSRREFNVLEALADTARADGSGIFAGVRVLAIKARVCERVCYLAMAALRARGWVVAERPGGGRTVNGPKRTIWRLNIPTLKQLPRFPQVFPQNVHNPDRLIRVNPDRSIRVNPDRLITQAADQTATASACCPVEIDPIRPVRTPSSKEHPSRGSFDFNEHADTERARLDAIGHLRMLKADVQRHTAADVQPRRRARG